MTEFVEIELESLDRGRHYRVWHHGEVLIEKTRGDDAMTPAARLLASILDPATILLAYRREPHQLSMYGPLRAFTGEKDSEAP